MIFDEAIIRHVQNTQSVYRRADCRNYKDEDRNSVSGRRRETMEVKGRNVITGLPKTVTVTSEEVQEALQECTTKIVEAVHSVLEKTPPELAADIVDRGIVLTGGGALLDGFEEVISQRSRNQHHDGRESGVCGSRRNRTVCGSNGRVRKIKACHRIQSKGMWIISYFEMKIMDIQC